MWEGRLAFVNRRSQRHRFVSKSCSEGVLTRAEEVERLYSDKAPYVGVIIEAAAIRVGGGANLFTPSEILLDSCEIYLKI